MVDDIRGRAMPRRNEDMRDEPSFVPPETVAANEEVIDMNQPGADEVVAAKDKPKGPKKPGKLSLLLSDIKYWWGKRKKNEKIGIVVGAAAGLALAAFGIYSVLKPKPVAKKPEVVQKKEEVKAPPKPTTEASKLTGLQVSPELNQLSVTGVMIENSPDARPQSGLKDAGVVFEAIAEGGITRFLALFQEAQPDYIGPVRSVRPYYLSWAMGFDAAIAHAGASPDAIQKLQAGGIKDLDQFQNGGAYDRVSSRYAPHNLYTSRSRLIALEKSKGFNSSNFTGFPRKAEKPANPMTAKSINFSISGPLYGVRYDFDNNNNNYLRTMAGQPHRDERSGAQLSPKVVIAMVVRYSIAPDGIHSYYDVIGSGRAFIFQDGAVTEGQWFKASDTHPVVFTDANGTPLSLNPGQTWITAVGAADDVSYTP